MCTFNNEPVPWWWWRWWCHTLVSRSGESWWQYSLILYLADRQSTIRTLSSIVDRQDTWMILWMECGVMMWNVEMCNRCIYRYISLLICRLCTVQYCPVKVSDDSLIQIYWTPTWLCRRTTGHFVQISRLMLGSSRTPQRTIYMWTWSHPKWSNFYWIFVQESVRRK